MSEGIIQKAFRNFETRLAVRMKPYNATKKDWLALEQNIIAEIKNEYRFGSLNCKVKEVREFLIGEE